MNNSRRYLIAAAVILIPLLLYGSAVAVSGLYASAQTVDLPVMPTFAYSTVTFPTPIVFGSPFPSVPAPTVFTPTATNTSTPLPTWTPTQYIVWYGTPVTPYYYYPVYPTPYLTPTPSPTITATLPPQPASSSLSNAPGCYNILYPVKPGQHWDYYVTAGSRSGNIGLTVVSVQGGFGNVNIANQTRGTNSNVQVVCDKDIILNFPFLNAETLFGRLNGTVNVAYVGGVLAPNEAAFIASNWALSWASQYLINGNGTIVYRGNTFNIVIAQSNVTMNCQTLASGAAAFEDITVAARTYRALKVVCTVQGQVTGTTNGSPISGFMSAQSTQWFAPYIGPVMIHADYANLEVFGITIPLNSGGAGTIELTNFSPGP